VHCSGWYITKGQTGRSVAHSRRSWSLGEKAEGATAGPVRQAGVRPHVREG
jgi:hypothetical protein